MKFSSILKGSAFIGGALLVAKGLDDRLETTHYTISSSKIPQEFDKFRIVQISDVHSATVPGLVAEIKGEAPDIIVSTGDLVHDRGSYEPAIRLIKKLTKIAPVYAVSGNHDLRRSDYGSYLKALDGSGVVSLHNQSTEIKKGNASIMLSGIEDPFSEDGARINNNNLNSFSKLNRTDNFHILLFHRANHLDILKDKGIDLILSGHMHGGQFRFPNGRGICAPKSSWGSSKKMLFPKYFGGHYKHNSTDMIVNRGIGNPMIIPRLFNRPEISVIILESSQS